MPHEVARRALSDVLAFSGRGGFHEANAVASLARALLAPLGGACPVAFESFPSDEALPAETAARLALAQREGAVGVEYLDAVRARVDRLVGEEHAAKVLREPPLVELVARLPEEMREAVLPLARWASAPVPAVLTAEAVERKIVVEQGLELARVDYENADEPAAVLLRALHTATVLSLTTAAARQTEVARARSAEAHGESRARATALVDAPAAEGGAR